MRKVSFPLSALARAPLAACLAIAPVLPAASLAARPPEVVVVASHHEVLPYWYRAARRGDLPRTGLVVVHLDAHPDMAVPSGPFKAGFPRLDSSHQRSVDIASFQLAAVRAGLVDRILWVRPAWARQIPDGEHRFFLGASAEGRLAVDATLDYYVLNEAWLPTDRLSERAPVALRVLRLDRPDGAGPLVAGDRPYVLDIDLDLFSTRNPSVDRLSAAGFGEEDIATIQRVFARENLSLAEDPAERRTDLAALEAAILALTAGAWYELPGALFTLWMRGLGPFDLADLYGVLAGRDEIQLGLLLREGRTVVGVPVHKSEQSEITAALDALRALLRDRLPPPRLVTIARSMDDGYTHPYWLLPVETGVLEVLAETLSARRVQYDGKLKALD